MASFNKVILIGNFTADPELKQTPSGVSVCRFTLAVNRRFARSANRDQQGQTQQQTADFITVVTWRQSAEFVARYFKKGRPILVCGQLQSRTWTDQQGNKQYATEVVADEVSFVESKGDSASGQGSGDASQGGNDTRYTPDAYGAPAYNSGAGTAAGFEEVAGDDSLPF